MIGVDRNSLLYVLIRLLVLAQLVSIDCQVIMGLKQIRVLFDSKSEMVQRVIMIFTFDLQNPQIVLRFRIIIVVAQTQLQRPEHNINLAHAQRNLRNIVPNLAQSRIIRRAINRPLDAREKQIKLCIRKKTKCHVVPNLSIVNPKL
jgi:hypothetical protein